jgi:hypothetical protein
MAWSGRSIQIFYEIFHKITVFYPTDFEASQINKLEALTVAISSKN